VLAHFIDSKSFNCGYFDDRKSFFEEYLLEDISAVEFEYLLAHGMRHFGDYFFRPRCKNCFQCVPLRLRTEEFATNRSQRRVLKACHDVEVRIGTPVYTEEKFYLYLRHKKRFNSLQDDVEDKENFRLSFYVHTPFGVEFEYYMDGKLVGAALGDCTPRTFSAVYTFYDSPDPRVSLGTFSVLRQLQYALKKGLTFFYLGYYISNNKSLTYKANFRPNELYIENEWRPFRSVKGDCLIAQDKVLWENTDFLVKASSNTGFL